MAGECISKVLKLGSFLSNTPKAELMGVLDNLAEKAGNILCSQAMLNYLFKNPSIDSAKDFLLRYDRPIDVHMENDIVWPHPTRLFPYE